MILQRTTEDECYSIVNEYQNRGYGIEFEAEIKDFKKRARSVLENLGLTTSDSAFATKEADFLFPPDDDLPDDRVLYMTSFHGSKMKAEILLKLSTLCERTHPEFKIFVDAQIEHGQPYVLALLGNGTVLGYEEPQMNFLVSLGYSEKDKGEPVSGHNSGGCAPSA